MKILKNIFLLALIFNATIIFSQNKKTNYPPPSPQNLPPSADFSWLNACAGDSVCFVNQTIRGNTYTWTVSDTNSHHPTTYYTSTNDTGFCYFFSPGSYSISLTAFNNHTVTKSKLLVIDTVLKADFAFVLCSNNFVNNSTCASSFYWDFGDGSHSTLALPNHQYADTGRYNVTLIAYKGSITDTMRQQIFVSIESFANADFTYTVSHDTVFVHSVYGGAGAQYYWTWESATYSTGQDTFHVYKDSTANYPVALNIVNNCGPSSIYHTVSVAQTPPLLPNFSFANTCLGDTTCFLNQSSGGITYTWSVSTTGFLPHVIDTSTNASGFCFRFPAIGNYSVTLKASNGVNTVSSIKIIKIDTLPRANFSFTHCTNSFLNLSACSSNFYWNFGDGTNSTQISPTHQYADTGFYQVTLITYNGVFSDTLKKTNSC